MTTIAHDTGHSALIDRLLELVLEALSRIAPPPAAADAADDIDWEDGEPETEVPAS